MQFMLYELCLKGNFLNNGFLKYFNEFCKIKTL